MNNRYKQEIEEWTLFNLMLGGSWIFFAIIGALIITGSTIAWYLWEPRKRAFEHRMDVESHQYQEARKESIIMHEQELARLNKEIARTQDPELKEALKEQRDVLKKRIERERRKQSAY